MDLHKFAACKYVTKNIKTEEYINTYIHCFSAPILQEKKVKKNNNLQLK